MTKTKDLILKLRAVYQEKKQTGDTSYDQIIALMEQDGEFTSKSTLSRLFGENWEKYSFDYEKTLIPIANALLDVETIEDEDDADTRAYKSLLRFKMSVIDDNAKRIAELQDQLKEVSNKERLKYQDKLEKHDADHQKSVEFLKRQIELKDKRIDQLLDSNDRLLEANDQLLKRLISCPLERGKCDEN